MQYTIYLVIYMIRNAIQKSNMQYTIYFQVYMIRNAIQKELHAIYDIFSGLHDP